MYQTMLRSCGHIVDHTLLFCFRWPYPYISPLPFLLSTTTKAIRLLENTRLKDEEEERQWKQVLVKLYLNLCLCDLRQKKPKPVITYCRKTLELDPENIKAHFRLGQVRNVGTWCLYCAVQDFMISFSLGFSYLN